MTHPIRKSSPSAVQRNSKRRRFFKEAGGRNINLLIGPEATRALAALMATHGVTMTACIERLLIDAAKKENLQ